MKPMLCVCLLFLTGCGFLGALARYSQDAADRATHERPDTGEVPAKEIAKGGGQVIKSVGDVEGWWKVIDNVAYVLTGTGLLALLGFGGHKAYKNVRNSVPMSKEEYTELIVNGKRKK